MKPLLLNKEVILFEKNNTDISKGGNIYFFQQISGLLLIKEYL